MKLKMGIVEGAFYDESKIVEMANIPSREVLIAKLLGSLKAPVSNFILNRCNSEKGRRSRRSLIA